MLGLAYLERYCVASPSVNINQGETKARNSATCEWVSLSHLAGPSLGAPRFHSQQPGNNRIRHHIPIRNVYLVKLRALKVVFYRQIHQVCAQDAKLRNPSLLPSPSSGHEGVLHHPSFPFYPRLSSWAPSKTTPRRDFQVRPSKYTQAVMGASSTSQFSTGSLT